MGCTPTMRFFPFFYRPPPRILMRINLSAFLSIYHRKGKMKQMVSRLPPFPSSAVDVGENGATRGIDIHRRTRKAV